MHQSGAAKPTCSRVSRVPPSIRSSKNVTIVGLPGAPPECHVNTSFFGASISKNSPSRVKGTPLPVPTARQRPPTRTSPAQSLVLNTPGLIHQWMISSDASARKTRVAEAAISTLPKIDLPRRLAAACARPSILMLSPQGIARRSQTSARIADPFLTSWLLSHVEVKLHCLKAVASGYGLKPDQSAIRRNSSHTEVVVRLRCRLVFDVLHPDLVGDIAAARHPVPPSPEVAGPTPLAQYPELTARSGSSSARRGHGVRL